MLELKFAICYRAASLPSQASYAVLVASYAVEVAFSVADWGFEHLPPQ